MPMMTQAQVDQRTALYAGDMLEYAEPVIVLGQFGVMKPMPPKKAATVEFRRFNPMSAITTPMVEGVTPTSQVFTYTDVAFTMLQYGAPIEITDQQLDFGEDDVIRDGVKGLGEQTELTKEMLLWGKLKAGTSVDYSNGAARASVNTPVTLDNVRACTRFLANQKAKKIREMLAPGMGFATRAIEASYIAFAHTNLEADIRNIPGFMALASYGTKGPMINGEIGSVEGTRFVLSPELTAFADAGAAKAGSGTEMISTTGTSADVYPLIFVGANAYCQVPFKGKGVKPKVIMPSHSAADPMGQRGYIAQPFYWAGGILNQSWMIRLECAATAL